MQIPNSPVAVPATLIACGLVAVLGAPASHAADKLAAAKTLQVKETFLRADDTGKLKPVFSFAVEIAKPKKVRILADSAEKPGNTALYITDGDKSFEYYGDSKMYRNLDPKSEGGPYSQVRYLSSADLLLDPHAPLEAGSKTKRAISKVTLDGKPMTLQADTYPETVGHDGKPATYTDHVWFDAKTGLPYRRSTTITTGGKTTTALELDFTGWTVDKPIAPKRFVFTPPAGATAFHFPTLLAAGTPAPDFAVLTTDGKTAHLSDFKGKTVILDFWATWCGPCQASMPHLEKIYQQVKSQDVAVLAVCVWDGKKEYDKWVTENIGKKYNFPVYFDPAGKADKNIAATLYHVSGIPAQYVIDKNGIIAKTNVGGGEASHQLEDSLKSLGVALNGDEAAATKPAAAVSGE